MIDWPGTSKSGVISTKRLLESLVAIYHWPKAPARLGRGLDVNSMGQSWPVYLSCGAGDGIVTDNWWVAVAYDAMFEICDLITNHRQSRRCHASSNRTVVLGNTQTSTKYPIVFHLRLHPSSSLYTVHIQLDQNVDHDQWLS